MLFAKKLFKRFISLLSSHIKYQLFLAFVLIVMFILVFVGSIFFRVFTDILVRKHYEYMVQLNHQIILNLDNNIYEIERASLILNYEQSLNDIMKASADNPELYNKDYIKAYKSVDNFFFNLLGSRQEIHGVYIYSLTGENSYSRNKDLTSHKNVRVNKESWFNKALERKGYRVLIGAHKNEFVDGSTMVISIARAVVDNVGNRILGVIVVDQNISYLEEIIDSIKIGEKGSVIIVNQENQLVYSNDVNMYNSISKYTDFINNIEKYEKRFYILGTHKDKIVVSQDISKYSGWKVITCIPYTELTKDNIIIRKTMVVISLVCLLLAFGISVFISAKASGQLIRLKFLMEEVEEGNLNVSAHVTGRNEISRLGMGFNSMVSRIKELIYKEYREKLMRKEAELNLLQTQINPHFLYNTLGLIKSTAKREGSENAANMIQCLSSIFRYNLGKLGSTVTVKDEIEHIKNWFMIQQKRFSDKIQVFYEIDEKAMNNEILIMTLQPIVENSIVHGFEAKKGRGRIIIRIACDNSFMKISVVDNGAGMNSGNVENLNSLLNLNESLENSTNLPSIGIFNVNSRIKLHFGTQYGLKILNNIEGGITVEIFLPKKQCNG